MQIKTTSINQLFDELVENKLVYESLSPDERAEVDAHNRKILGLPIEAIIAAGDHPMKRFKERWRKENS